LAKDIRKFINYTKEAFFWPFHLIGMGILAMVTAGAMVLLYNVFHFDVLGIGFVFGGLELTFLSLITRSKRFRRAINMKYRVELQSYAYVAKLTEYYNILSAKSQRRFEEFRVKLGEAKQNYSKLNERFPEIVQQYQEKIDVLQLNYIRLLSTFDRFPDLLKQDDPTNLRRQIEEIRGSMGDDTGKLREIKEKRIALLQDRMRNYNGLLENSKLVSEQLRTIEEMLKYLIEQPLATKASEGTSLIDNLLTETGELHNTLSQVEEIMRSDLGAPDYAQSGGSYDRNAMQVE
jgi:hypothetical protein